ncbi:hypothetical protein M409DRAFT_51202 [Zasmidium cellare ATCC 36951]|uniref:Uncharacterized protein n=1 Tax=Zasmidium cellare ATCC 36951 TaxID=1080233 RepID=A0A6A6CW80_ZASCE|nr:uncharacterized protein M409DRAFT_51202 [Zasmidium cellare ATCC 36951]KAF2170963.1 hypothetical protein M409DRAFT_51202 [Zasmidium cellare ATCC 36951]
MSIQFSDNKVSNDAAKAIARKRLRQLGVAVANSQRRHHMALLQYKVFRAAMAKAEQSENYEDLLKYLSMTDPARGAKAAAWMMSKLRKSTVEGDSSQSEQDSHVNDAYVELNTPSEAVALNEIITPKDAIVAIETPKPKKRGRPSKADLALRLEQQVVAKTASPAISGVYNMTTPPRKRGRPSKVHKIGGSQSQSPTKRRGRPWKAILLQRSQRSQSEDIAGLGLCDAIARE